MARILAILVPVMVVALIVFGALAWHRRTENVQSLRQKVRLLESNLVFIEDERAVLRAFLEGVTTATSPEIMWGGEELLRERMHTLTSRARVQIEAIDRKRQRNQERNEQLV